MAKDIVVENGFFDNLAIKHNSLIHYADHNIWWSDL
jgi:hypothetical protein